MAASFSSSQKRYDVFLSFRGDTRNNFTAHLLRQLRTKGINTFFDEDKLERGLVISPALITAIENSMFFIIVLSENYASSRWCLEELVKILKCNKSKEQRVLPIFYNVDPSDVRNHRGKFGEALAKHEENLEENSERVKIWRDALTEVANLSGWASSNKNEADLIDDVIKKLLKLLNAFISDTKENLVGIDARIQAMKMRLCLESNDVRIVGICGMGGIGKTILARAIYSQIFDQFEACSFLEIANDFDKRDLTSLEEKLLCQLLEEENLKIKGPTFIKARLYLRKVLVVLDNVNDITILDRLAGNRDWFGQGSRIIVTTRNKGLLSSYGVDYYEVAGFDGGEALEFLKRQSLKHELLENDLQELSREIIYYAQGLPLALRVLGSFLFSMNKDEWRDYFAKLKSAPNLEIQEVLKLSYDRLDHDEKNIFLDIACFFKGEDKDHVMEILAGCDFFPYCGIRALINKSLITISANKLEMHDLIQDMGKQIVRQECPKEPGRRSRLWHYEDIFDVLKENMGNKKIEGIFLNLSHLEDRLNFTTEAFAGMNKLRLLKVYNSNTSLRDLRDFEDTFYKENCKVQFSHGFKLCSNDLRYLYWHGYSLKSLPNDFSPKHLVELNMPYSHVKQLWKGIKVLEKLKFMDLSHSMKLTQTPDFSRITNLERLVLEGCINLCKVHPSLGDLNKLNFLSLKNCKMLGSLPSSICNLKSLETFILSGCSKFEEFPENFGNLEMLKELHADGIMVRVLPPSFFSMRNLQKLSFRGCKGSASTSWLWSKRSSNSICFTIPSSSNLRSLMELDLSDCNILDGANLSGLDFLPSLERLNLSGNNFITLPNMSRLSYLQKLLLENCKRLQTLPQLPSSICALNAKNCTSLETIELLNSLLVTVESKESKEDAPQRYRMQDPTYSVLIPGSRIPEWIRYQSSRSVIEAYLPSNWSTNVLGFAFALVAFRKSLAVPNDRPFPFVTVFLPTCEPFIVRLNSVANYQGMESDHVLLTYVPFCPKVNCHQVTHITASFMCDSSQDNDGIKRCGFSPVYANEEVNCDNARIIQFNSLFSTPPPNRSTLVLKEIYAGEPIACESLDDDNDDDDDDDDDDDLESEGTDDGKVSASESGSEPENPDYPSEDEGKPGESESELQGTISLHEGEPSGSRCSGYNDSHSCHGSESEETKDLQITPNLPRNSTLASGLVFLLGMGIGILGSFFWMKGRAFLPKEKGRRREK